MQSSTTKKVLVHRFDREAIPGFVNPASYLQTHFVEILLVSGIIQQIPYEEIKMIAFVKDFDPPRGHIDQRTFQSRPKMEGLWVRMRLRDSDEFEGLLPNELARLETQGYMLTPPNLTGNTQRLFVPRVALEMMQVVAVVGAKAARKPKPVRKEQIELFGDAEATS